MASAEVGGNVRDHAMYVIVPFSVIFTGSFQTRIVTLQIIINFSFFSQKKGRQTTPIKKYNNVQAVCMCSVRTGGLSRGSHPRLTPYFGPKNRT